MRTCIAAFALLAAIPLAANGGDVRASFVVSAFVPARASLEAVTGPVQLLVSEQDVARGYLEVAAVYRVRNNDPAGYLLRLDPRTGLTRSIEVSGLETQVVMRDELVEVYRACAGEPEDLTLEYRFVLEPDAQPGTYELPIHVSATPL